MGADCITGLEAGFVGLEERFTFSEEKEGEITKVRKAWDKASSQYVAVKCWKAEDPAGVQEVSVLSALSHSGIPSFLCSFEQEGTRYLVRQWVEGVTLDVYRQQENFPTDVASLRALFSTLCTIVTYLHEHQEGPFLHLDLKPSNIICREDPKKASAVSLSLIDLESVRKPGSNVAAPSDETLLLASPFYLAPETLRGEFTPACDVYSLGAILFFLITGRPPKMGEVLPGRHPFRSFLKRCLDQDPTKRYASVSEMQRKFMSPNRSYQSGQYHSSAGKTLLFPKPFSPDWRKAIITVEGNLCFACELAYLAAHVYHLCVGLFPTSPFLEDRLGYFLDWLPSAEVFVCEDTWVLKPRMRNVLQQPKEFWRKEGYLKRSRTTQNLYVGRAPALPTFLPHGKADMPEFCYWGREQFDLVILVTDVRQDGLYRQCALEYSDAIVVAMDSNVEEVEQCKEYYSTLCKNLKLDHGQLYYVAWDYQADVSLPEVGIAFLVDEKNYLGSISFRLERMQCRNNGFRYFSQTYQDVLAREYGSILDELLRQL